MYIYIYIYTYVLAQVWVFKVVCLLPRYITLCPRYLFEARTGSKRLTDSPSESHWKRCLSRPTPPDPFSLSLSLSLCIYIYIHIYIYI